MPDVYPIALTALDSASADFTRYSEVAANLSGEAVPGSDPDMAVHIDALRAALYFSYRDGAFEGSYAGDPKSPWAKDPRSVPADKQDVWAAYAQQAAHLGIRARLHHLLYACGHDAKYRHAREAITGYQETAIRHRTSAQQPSGRVQAAHCLTEALDLALAMNLDDLRNDVVKDMLAMSADLLKNQAPAAGLVLHLLEPLCERGLAPSETRPLVDLACESFSDINLKLAFLHIRRRMGDAEAARTIDQRIVRALIGEAEQAVGMLKVTWLNQAATAARDAGLGELRDEALRQLQRTDRSSLGLVPVGNTVQMRQDLFDIYLARIDAASTLPDALWVVGRPDAPPAGTIGAAQQFAKTHAETAPFLAAIAHGRLNSNGPVPVSAAGVDGLTAIQAEHQHAAMVMEGIRVAAQLERIQERFNPDEDDLLAALTHDQVGPAPRLRMLAHAFQYFWLHEDDAAMHLALPRVEAILREILRSRDVPVVNPAQGKTPGGMSPLGGLISSMPDAGFSNDWTRSFKLLLTDGEQGMNLRNDVLHGLCECPPRSHVALVLQAALFLLREIHGDGPGELSRPASAHEK